MSVQQHFNIPGCVNLRPVYVLERRFLSLLSHSKEGSDRFRKIAVIIVRERGIEY